MWSNIGDLNIAFFHNHASIKNHVNKISAIVDNASLTYTDQPNFANCLSKFYFNLWNSTSNHSISDLISALPNDHHILS